MAKKVEKTESKKDKFFLKQDRKTALIINGNMLYSWCQSIGGQIDFDKLLSHFEQNSNFIRGHYFTTMKDDDKYESIMPLIDYLEHNRWTTHITDLQKKERPDGGVSYRGSSNIPILVEMFKLAKSGCEEIFLMHSDWELETGIELIKEMGCRVIIVANSDKFHHGAMKRISDRFIELDEEILTDFRRVHNKPETALIAV